MTTPIAYAYEADHHCPRCAEARFGADENGEITGEDDEGNEISVVMEHDEWHVCKEHLASFPDFPATLACTDCDAVLETCKDCEYEIEYRSHHHITVKRALTLWRWKCECDETYSQWFATLDGAKLDILEHILDGAEDTIIINDYSSMDEYEPAELLEAVR